MTWLWIIMKLLSSSSLKNLSAEKTNVMALNPSCGRKPSNTLWGLMRMACEASKIYLMEPISYIAEPEQHIWNIMRFVFNGKDSFSPVKKKESCSSPPLMLS